MALLCMACVERMRLTTVCVGGLMRFCNTQLIVQLLCTVMPMQYRWLVGQLAF